ncbi:YtxH domain-containing protein [Desulfoscipio sp. XC116]|uniref:YtxH domain-containing protein n=1 Tax=Desulfoscipio sp. XC116 TaxID=3144975 RepID=UPI00325B2D4D
MQRGFWRGLVTGSVLGAVMSMIKRPQRKPASMFDISKIRRRYPRRTTDRVIREVSRTVSGLIKKK